MHIFSIDSNSFDLSFLCSNYRNHTEILLMTPVSTITQLLEVKFN